MTRCLWPSATLTFFFFFMSRQHNMGTTDSNAVPELEYQVAVFDDSAQLPFAIRVGAAMKFA
jgi:hypothetical protein